MIKHIVMWSLKEKYKGQLKEQLAEDLKNRLLNLKSMIPQIKKIVVGINEVKL